MSGEVAIRETDLPAQRMSIMDVPMSETAVDRLNQFQNFCEKKFVENVDFGPPYHNSKKNTLLKPGAEKLVSAFQLTPEYDVLEHTVVDHEKGYFFYELRCRLMYGDRCVGQGVGSANSKEKKYRYKWMTSEDINNDPDLSGLDVSKLLSRRAYNKVQYRIENQDPHDIANTVLKIAKKRAMLDAVLSVFSLSSTYTQDLEETQPERERQSRSQGKRQPQPAQSNEKVFPTEPSAQEEPTQSNVRPDVEKKLRQAEAYLKAIKIDGRNHTEEEIDRAFNEIMRHFNVMDANDLTDEQLPHIMPLVKDKDFHAKLRSVSDGN